MIPITLRQSFLGPSLTLITLTLCSALSGFLLSRGHSVLVSPQFRLPDPTQRPPILSEIDLHQIFSSPPRTFSLPLAIVLTTSALALYSLLRFFWKLQQNQPMLLDLVHGNRIYRTRAASSPSIRPQPTLLQKILQALQRFHQFIDDYLNSGETSSIIDEVAATLEQKEKLILEFQHEAQAKEADIRTQRNRLHSILESMHDGLIVIDRSNRIALHNHAAKDLLEPVHKILSPCGEQSHINDCIECLGANCDQAEPSPNCELQVQERIFEIQASRVYGGLPEESERLYVIRDISERRSRQQREIHQERMAVLGQVAAMMAHELNNPLSAITMFGQTLESQLPVGSIEREWAQVIHRNTLACKDTIRRFLDCTAVSAREPISFCVQETIENVLGLLRPLARRAGVNLSFASSLDSSQVISDPVALRQILMNLLMNAFQQPGSSCTEVSAALSASSDDFLIQIIDNGSGVPADIHNQIFKPFFTTKPPGQGTGLGLPISRQLIESLGGTLDLWASIPGHTEFRILLPNSSPSSLRLSPGRSTAAASPRTLAFAV